MKDASFQKHLASIILDNKYDRYVKNRKSGKLDSNSLYKAGHSPKVFKRREARLHKDYAVTLLVDCSGSMDGPKMRIAADSAQRLSKHLSILGVQHNVLGFNAGVLQIKPFGPDTSKTIQRELLEEMSESKATFYYWDMDVNVKLKNGGKASKFLAVHKATEEKDCTDYKIELERKTGHDVHSVIGAGYNSDAEAVSIARELLLKQKGEKILIVLSDGSPVPLNSRLESPIYEGTVQNEHQLKEQVKITLKEGVQVYSIGIMSPAVTSYYPMKRTRVIKKVDELYGTVVELVKKNIKRG